MAESFEIAVRGHRLTGIRGGVGNRNGFVLAVHGGGYDARYWHVDGGDGDVSLITLGAQLGYEVLAIDRPGYAGSAGTEPGGYSLAHQADLLFALVEQLANDRPTFLIGHSMGGIVSLRMAALPQAERLTGIDVSGVPLRYAPQLEGVISRFFATGQFPDIDEASMRRMFYGQEGSYDPVHAHAIDNRNAVPPVEMVDAFRTPDELPPLLTRIRVPVQWTIADQERSSIGGTEMLEQIRAALPSCERLVTNLQIDSGHNISVHHVARAYHLRAMAFFEECRLRAARA